MTGRSKTGLFVVALLAAGVLARPVMAADNSRTQMIASANTPQVLAFKDQTAVSQPGAMTVSEPVTPRIKNSAPHR